MRTVLLALALLGATAVSVVPAADAASATAQCPATDGTNVGVKVSPTGVPVTVSVTDTRTGTAAAVVVTFTDDATGFSLRAASSQPDYVIDATWCVRSSTSTTEPVFGAGTSGTSPAANKKGALQRIHDLTLYTVTTEPPLVVCLDSSVLAVPDATLAGPVNTRDNLATYSSTDGTCTAPSSRVTTLVTATTWDEAQATCIEQGTPGVDALMSERGYPMPVGWWLCLATVSSPV